MVSITAYLLGTTGQQAGLPINSNTDGSLYIEGPHPNCIITVSKDGTMDYTTLKDAMDAIGTTLPASSSTNRYCIVVYPSTAGGTTDYQESNPITGKNYTSITTLGWHEIVRFTCTNDDNGLICGSDAEYIGVNIRRASPGSAGYAAYKILAGTVDLDIHDCKASNFDSLIWCRANIGSGIQVRQFNVGSGTCTNVILCDNDGTDYGALIVNDLYIGTGVTATNVFNINGYSSTTKYCVVLASMVNIRGTNVTNGIRIQNSGRMTIADASIYTCAVGAYVSAGTLYVGGTTFFKDCVRGIKIDNTSGFVEGRCLFVASASTTYDIETTVAGKVSIGTQEIDFTKVSLASGTDFSCNAYEISDQTYTNQADTYMLLGTYQTVISAQTVKGASAPGGPQTRNHTNSGNMRIAVDATGITTAGTLVLTGTSYDPVAGTTTGGDTESLVIATGAPKYVRSTKYWTGTVVLSGSAALDVVVTTYRDHGYEHSQKRIIIEEWFFTIMDTAVGSSNHTFNIIKRDDTAGYVTLYTTTIASVQNTNLEVFRKKLNTLIDTTKGGLYLTLVSGSTTLRRVRWRLVLESE